MAKILVVDDDETITELLHQELTADGHDVDVANNGAEGRAQRAACEPDLIVLDLGLPDASGHDLARHFRAKGDGTPILMLTAQDAPSSVVQGLDAGADDYLTKPFELTVLKARIRALLRRGSTPPTTRTYADLHVDLVRSAVTVGGRPVKLTPKEYDLLCYFMARAEQIVSRRELLSKLWGINFDPGSNLADVTITRLRGKLGESEAEIAAIRGRGYMLTHRSNNE